MDHRSNIYNLIQKWGTIMCRFDNISLFKKKEKGSLIGMFIPHYLSSNIPISNPFSESKK